MNDIKKAEEIAREVEKSLKNTVKPGRKLVEIAEEIEETIRMLGGKPAFPVNLSKNEIAAHYTPEIYDETVVEEKDVLKVDVGVEINGFIVDFARTFDFSCENASLVEAAKEAVEKAVEEIKPGKKIGEISRIIEKTIVEKGYKPIANLTGHKIERYNLHAGIEIPNVAGSGGDYEYELKEGDVFAIEPFATNGRGFVRDKDEVMIFRLIKREGRMKRKERQEVLDYIKENYPFLPFAKRWIDKKFGSFRARNALIEMLREKIIMAYPVLTEKKDSLVSQWEHTIIVEKDGAKILC